ncbi:hypothetical protein MGC_02993 [Candida albicans P37039]|nr:hypothetical protein MGC_02993 [Candida albicans P37039]
MTSVEPDIESEALLEIAANDAYQAIIEEEEDVDEANSSQDEDVIWLREQIENNKAISWINRPSVYILGLVICIFMIAFASTIGVKQIILFKLACNTVANSKGYCDPIETQVLVSSYEMYSMVGGTLVSLIPVAKAGELSDIYGRKPFFIAMFVSATTSHLCSYLIFHHYNTFPFKLLLGAQWISSICGGMIMVPALIGSYISDIVESQGRIYALGLGMSSLFIGQSLGPMFGNWINSIGKHLNQEQKEKIGIRAITTLSSILPSEFFLLKIEIIIDIIICIYVITLFPESRNAKARAKSRANSITSSRSSNSNSNSNSSTRGGVGVFIGTAGDAVDQLQELNNQQQSSSKSKLSMFFNIFSPLVILTYPTNLINENGKHRASQYRFVVISLIISQCINMMMIMTLGQILIQYGIFVFDWSSEDVGNLLTVLASTRAIILIVILPIFQNKILKKKFKFRVLKKQLDMIDYSLMLIGYSVDFIFLILLVYTKSTTQVLTLGAFYSIGSIAHPTTQSTLLKFYPTSKIGVVFGANTLLHNIVGVVAPVMIMNFYSKTLKNGWPGAVFILYSLLVLIIIILVVVSKRVLKLNVNTTDERLIRSNSSVSLSRSNVAL